MDSADEASPVPASLRDPKGKRRAATDDAGLRTASRSRLPSGAVLDLDADDADESGRRRDVSSGAGALLLDRLDLTVDDAGAPTGTDALADDPAFASPPPSPPPSGRSQPTATMTTNGRTLPKPKRATAEPASSTSSRPALTLRDQEKVIDEVKKDNFSLKLKIFFLEERLAKLAPDQIDAALRENIELKVEFQTLQQELKKHKRMCLKLERALDAVQKDKEAAVAASDAGTSTSGEAHRLREERDRLREELRKRDAAPASAWDAEDQRAEIARLRDELQAEREAREQLLSGGGGRSSAGSTDDVDRLQRRIRELREDNASLSSQLGAQATLLASRDAEKEQLLDELDAVRQDVGELEAELAARGGTLAPDAARLEDELNQLRDRLSSEMLENERKEQELQELVADADSREAELVAEVDRLKQSLVQCDELIDDREAECKELADKLGGLEQLVAERDAEIDALTDDLHKLGDRNAELEDGWEEREAELESQMNLNAALKDVRLTDRLARLTEQRAATYRSQNDSHSTERVYLREQVEQLAVKTAEIEQLSRAAEAQRDELQSALRREELERERIVAELKRAARETEARHQSTLSAKESSLNEALADLGRLRDRAKLREADMERLQDGLRQSSSGERLEIDRLKRDLVSAQSELDRARAEAERVERLNRDRDLALSNLRAENTDIVSQLATQTSRALALTDKVDASAKALRAAESKQAAAEARLRDAESRVGNDSRGLNRSEAKYRDQVGERNALLVSINQQLDRTLGKPSSTSDALKPTTHFASFSDMLLSRLKQVGSLRTAFDRRASELERRFGDSFGTLRKQYDTRLKQLDALEHALRQAAETQRQWRQRMHLKQSELDSAKTTSAELQTQIESLRSRTPSNPAEPGASTALTAALHRASTAERRLARAETELAEARKRLDDGNAKVGKSTASWEARVKELEHRCRVAEERLKQERQGAKERVAELENRASEMARDLGDANRRRDALGDVVSRQQQSSS